MIKTVKFDLRYPVNARATTAFGVKLHAFGMVRGLFDISVVKDDTHPVVATFQSGRVGEARIRYRQDLETGQMYRHSCTLNVLRETLEPGTHRDDEPGYDLLLHMRDREYRDLVTLDKRVCPNPSDNPSLSFMRRMNFADHHLDTVNSDDMARCLAEAEAVLERYVIIGNNLWEPCREPTLKVKRGTNTWNIEIGHHDFFSSDWNTYYFALDEFDEARQWQDILDEELGEKPRRDVSLELMDGFKSVCPGSIEDARQLVCRVMRKVAEAGESLADQSPSIITTYAMLKEFMELGIEDIENEDIDNAFGRVFDLCRCDEEGGITYTAKSPGGGRNYRLRELRQAIELHHRKWQDRPIDMAMPGATRAP